MHFWNKQQQYFIRVLLMFYYEMPNWLISLLMPAVITHARICYNNPLL